MKKILCTVISCVLIVSLFSGCNQAAGQESTQPKQQETQETPFTENTGTESTAETSGETIGMQTDATQATSEETTPQEFTDAPSFTPEPKPTEGVSSTMKPTESAQQDSNIINGDLIAFGKWDGGPVEWKITKDGVLIITGNRSMQGAQSYIWKDYSYLITKVVFSDGITSIPENAFSQMTNITSVELGSGLEIIEKHAFWGCTALQSVTFPANLKTIGPSAFSDCTNLQTISFPGNSNLQEICEYAFARSGILEFTAPASLRIIEGNAFTECKQLKTVVLEDGPTTLRGQAFTNCTGLQTLIIGEAVTDVGGFVFYNCKAITTLEDYSSAFGSLSDLPHLRTLVVGGSNTSSGTYSNCPSLTSVTFLSDITEIRGGAFENCTSLSQITLPSTVTHIQSSAFRNTGLTSITIPASVRDISLAAFLGTPLTEIVFTGDAPSFANSTVFDGVTATAYYPDGNVTWTPEVQQECGGNLTWVAN